MSDAYLVIHHNSEGQTVMKLTQSELADFLENFETDYENPANVTNVLHDSREVVSPPELLILEWHEVRPICKQYITKWKF